MLNVRGDTVTLAHFLDALGGLHDATLERLEWLPEKQAVALHFDDLLSNFEGLKGYKGPQPGAVMLSGVSRCLITVPVSKDTASRVFSFDCHPSEEESILVSRLALWPSGIVEVAHCAAEFPEGLASIVSSIE